MEEYHFGKKKTPAVLHNTWLLEHGACRIIVALWGWMSAAGIGELYEVSARMDSEEWIEMLRTACFAQCEYYTPEFICLEYISSMITAASTRQESRGDSFMTTKIP